MTPPGGILRSSVVDEVTQPPGHSSDHALLGYLAPMIAFGVVTALEGYVPEAGYPLIYTAKIAAVLLCFGMWRQPLADLRGSATPIVSSVLLGLFVFVLWIGLEEYVPYPHMGSRAGFDPGVIASDAGRLAFLCVRLLGLVIVVPVMEELLWRSLVLRYFTSEDFLSVPIGRFATSAFFIMVVGFALTHSEWAAAAVTAALYGGWVWRTKSLLAVVIAHATTNAALGMYVLATGRWYYW